MRNFRDIPVRRKLSLVTVLVGVVGLLLVGATAITHDLYVARQVETRQLRVEADMIGAHGSAALAFKDAQRAAEALTVLRTDPELAAAGIYAADGRLLAQYVRGDDPRRSLPVVPRTAGMNSVGGELELFRDVAADGEKVGTVYLRSDLRESRHHLEAEAGLMLGVMVLLMLASFVVSARLQRVVAEPILELASVARGVTERNDYSLRARPSGRDEVGQLVGAFNRMLQQIQDGDAARRAACAESESHRQQLEAELRERQRLEREILEISDREQRRLGQDLHDGLCQQLTATALAARSLEDDLERLAPAAAARAAEIAELINQVNVEAREVARGAYPVELEMGGLAAALGDLAASARRLGHLECQCECAGAVQISDPAVALHLYRIAQESVNNAIKHAQARRIEIRLQAGANQPCLMVSDDGIGLPSGGSQSGGMGLHLMRYRAKIIGGSLDLRGRDGGGTVVSCCLAGAFSIGTDELKTATQDPDR